LASHSWCIFQKNFILSKLSGFTRKSPQQTREKQSAKENPPGLADHRSRFCSYVASPWRHQVKPDLVLIDGRFRVACFLHSLLNAEPGTRIIFDDYNNRPHYHLVEEFCPTEEREGRQALFLVPDQLDRSAIVAEEERFLYVRD